MIEPTKRIGQEEIRNYCEFPPEWGCLFTTGNPYANIRDRINAHGQREWEIPTRLLDNNEQ